VVVVQSAVFLNALNQVEKPEVILSDCMEHMVMQDTFGDTVKSASKNVWVEMKEIRHVSRNGVAVPRHVLALPGHAEPAAEEAAQLVQRPLLGLRRHRLLRRLAGRVLRPAVLPHRQGAQPDRHHGPVLQHLRGECAGRQGTF